MKLPTGLSVALLSVAATGVWAAIVDGPINKNCPIGNEPIEANGETTKYKGHEIGFCCGGCDERFVSWDEAKKDAFVSASLGVLGEEADPPAAQEPTEKRKSDLYTLNTCAVAGGELGSMGDPIVYDHNGREVRFCCEGCVTKFEANPDKYLAKVDEQLVKQQLRYYPNETCAVAGSPLGEMGDPINYIHNNRLVRFCCGMCEKKFKADPEDYLKKLDEAIIAKQGGDYPLEDCVVAGGELGEMGEPIDMIVGNRLVRLCCSGCEKKVKADPAKYIKVIDEARPRN